MNTASELRKSLADMLPAEQIDQIIAGAVERGEVENDEGTGSLTPGVVKSLVSELRDSLESVSEGVDEVDFFKSEDQADLFRLEDDADYIDVEATLSSVVNTANATSGLLKSLARHSEETDSALARGVLALGQLTEHVLGQQAALAKSQGEIAAQLNAVATALRVPVAPRAVTGMAQKVPHPGEITKSEAGGVAEVGSAVTATDLVEKCLAEQHRLQGSDDPQGIHKSQQLASAISRLTSGVPVAQVISDLPTVRAIASA